MSIEITLGYTLIGGLVWQQNKVAKAICNWVNKTKPGLNSYLKLEGNNCFVVFGPNLFAEPTELNTFDFGKFLKSKSKKAIAAECFNNFKPELGKLPPKFGVIKLG